MYITKGMCTLQPLCDPMLTLGLGSPGPRKTVCWIFFFQWFLQRIWFNKDSWEPYIWSFYKMQGRPNSYRHPWSSSWKRHLKDTAVQSSRIKLSTSCVSMCIMLHKSMNADRQNDSIFLLPGCEHNENCRFLLEGGLGKNSALSLWKGVASGYTTNDWSWVPALLQGVKPIASLLDIWLTRSMLIRTYQDPQP